MIPSFFKLKGNVNIETLLNELLKPVFYENVIEKMYSPTLDLNFQNTQGEGLLHLCVKKNLTESVKWLLTKGIDIELVNNDKETALFYAVKVNSKEILKLLIEHNVNLDHTNVYQRTALQEAVIHGNINAVEILLSKIKNINNVDQHGRNIIFDAVSNGNMKLIKKIASNKSLNINQIDNDLNSILHQKATLENDEIAMLLLDHGADPTIPDKNGKNFLFYTAAKGIESEHLIDKAISNGCNINSRAKNNQNVLMEVLLAFSKLSQQELDRRDSLYKMVNKLLSKGIDINAFDNEGETALFIAVRQNNLSLVAQFIENKNILIDHQNNFGDTVLSVACMNGIKFLDLILLLLNNGANTNLKDKFEQTIIEKLINMVLMTQNGKDLDHNYNRFNLDDDGKYFIVLKEVLDNSAVNLLNLNSEGKPLFFDSVFYKNKNLFKLLKKYGSDLNQKDSNNHNILYNFMANAQSKYNFTIRVYLDTLEELLNMGIDVNSRDSFGGTTLHKAILENCEQTVKLLMSFRVDMNAVDIKGRNVIHNCVWKGKIAHFRVLMQQNIQILNQPDKFGVLPINYAAFMGHQDLVLEMLTAGSYVNNNYSKNKKMLEFLSQFNENLDNLLLNIELESDKKNIQMLIENMRSEFKI